MRLSAPKNSVWGASVALGVIGLIGKYISIPLVSQNAFWFVFAGFIILAVATMLKRF